MQPTTSRFKENVSVALAEKELSKAKLSAKSVVTWPMPYLSATSRVLSKSRLISDTTSTPSMFLIPSKCLMPNAPAPASATF